MQCFCTIKNFNFLHNNGEEAQEDEERERVCKKQGHQREGDHGGVVDAEG